jgi:hypothetical protein
VTARTLARRDPQPRRCPATAIVRVVPSAVECPAEGGSPGVEVLRCRRLAGHDQGDEPTPHRCYRLVERVNPRLVAEAAGRSTFVAVAFEWKDDDDATPEGVGCGPRHWAEGASDA